MESIITNEILDQVWEIGNQRIIELESLKKDFPTLTNQIMDLKKEYIICLNAISIRDFNRIENRRIVINKLEEELEILVKERKADQKRQRRAKQIKEESNIETLEMEEFSNGQ